VLACVLRRHLPTRRFVLPAAALLMIAVAYMAPWDHAAAI
jgi:hypothetical protein